MTLVLQPGTTLLQSPWPIDRIWRANLPGSAETTVELGGEPAAVLVFRGADDAGFVVLTDSESRFVAALLAGDSLQAAADAGFSGAEDQALARCLARLLGSGVLAAIAQLDPAT